MTAGNKKPSNGLHPSPDMKVYATVATDKDLLADDPGNQRRYPRYFQVLGVAGKVEFVDHRNNTVTIALCPVGPPVWCSGAKTLKTASTATDVAFFW